MFVLFFFKQKTAYEMRISDWSSDVCSSDLQRRRKLTVIKTPAVGSEHAVHQAPRLVEPRRITRKRGSLVMYEDRSEPAVPAMPAPLFNTVPQQGKHWLNSGAGQIGRAHV